MKWKQIKIWLKDDRNTSETHCFYVFLVKLLWWKSSYQKNSRSVKKIDHLFNMASEILGADNLHLFLLFDGSRIDNNEYLSSLENGIELIVCTKEKIQKLLIYFELKRYLSFKNVSYPLDIDYILCYSKTTLNKRKIFSNLILTPYFVAHWRNW